MHRSLTVKKSPIVIVRNFVALQCASAALYLFAGSMAYYAQIWRTHAMGGLISFQLAQGAFLFLGELVLTLYIFVSWYRQTIVVSDDQLVYDQGVLFRRHTIIARERIASMSFTQNILGRLIHYGTVSLHDGGGAVLLRLTGISEPRQFIDQVMARNRPESVEDDPARLLMSEEHEFLERKSTLRWDMTEGKVNKSLERATLKTVAAFLNTDGGHLVLGVGDDRSIIGMHHDYATLARKDADGFVNHFGNIFNAAFGAHVRHLVKVRPFATDGKECMLVSVAPSSRPVYMDDEGREELFVRTGNGTTSLKLSEAHAYIQSRWGSIH